MTIGEKIKARRKELGMTTEELGQKIGVQRSAINKYEKGLITDLKRSTIAALANALNVSVFYLLDDDPNDEDQQILEALHQDPKLRLLFDRAVNMSAEDRNKMLQISEIIKGELYGE